MLTRRFRGCFALFLVLFLVSSTIPLGTSAQTQNEEITDLEGINVAVYGGEGAVTHCLRALASLFEWLNASVEIIHANTILNETLEAYEIVAYPGGNAFDYHVELGREGLNIIREFVSNGGSYVGICGGSTFACEQSLGFFNGSRGLTPYEGIGPYLINMTVNRECEGPDLSDLPENITTMYWGSVYFAPPEGLEIYPIASYGANGEIGMLAFNYGHGTVFISSPHPEYEEGSDRDGTVFCDELNDPDSEYELLRRVMVWLIEESYVTPESNNTETTTNSTDSGIVSIQILGSIGVAAIIVVVVAFVYHKKR
jgi:glutamine amidotransferase-like uncharacterized protein